MSQSYSYYGDAWLVYLAELFRKNGYPKRAYKIGITNARDPMLRLTYKRADEPRPILNYFSDIQLVRFISFPTEYQAERAERFIMWKIKQISGTPKFHNWEEPDKFSGITETRIWNLYEINLIKNDLMEQCIQRYA
jgi:hypothetical protein